MKTLKQVSSIAIYIFALIAIATITYSLVHIEPTETTPAPSTKAQNKELVKGIFVDGCLVAVGDQTAYCECTFESVYSDLGLDGILNLKETLNSDSFSNNYLKSAVNKCVYLVK